MVLVFEYVVVVAVFRMLVGGSSIGGVDGSVSSGDVGDFNGMCRIFVFVNSMNFRFSQATARDRGKCPKQYKRKRFFQIAIALWKHLFLEI